MTFRIFEKHESGPCPVCGLYLVSRVEGDREVIIHELPHCDRFRRFTEQWLAKPGTMREPVQVAGVKQ